MNEMKWRTQKRHALRYYSLGWTNATSETTDSTVFHETKTNGKYYDRTKKNRERERCEGKKYTFGVKTSRPGLNSVEDNEKLCSILHYLCELSVIICASKYCVYFCSTPTCKCWHWQFYSQNCYGGLNAQCSPIFFSSSMCIVCVVVCLYVHFFLFLVVSFYWRHFFWWNAA